MQSYVKVMRTRDKDNFVLQSCDVSTENIYRTIGNFYNIEQNIVLDVIMANNSDKLDQEYTEYLQSKIKQRGKITLQNLSGHLSQVSPEIRRRYGTSPKCLKSFLILHPDIFDIKGDLVTLTVNKEESNKDNIADSIESIDMACKDVMPHHLSEVKGKIIRLFPQFGFISITDPCKTTVYFDGAKFGDGSCTYLEDLKLKVGQAVLLNAVKMPKGKGADYRALKVWLPPSSSNMKNMPLQDSSKFLSQTSLESFSEDSELYHMEGTIQKLFDKYGFINFKKNPGSVFFHMKNIARCPFIGSDVKLTDFLKRGDNVTFNAIPSKKQNNDVPWEATKVWLPSSCFKSYCNELSGEESEIFQSTSEESEEEDEKDLQISSFQEITKKTNTESVVTNDKNVCVHSTSPVQKSDFSSSNTTKLDGMKGKIFPEKTDKPDKAIIKFKSQNEEILISANIDVIYLNGERAKNLKWDVDEGWEVYFNAIRDPDEKKWKATLVWRGHMPFAEENTKSSTNRPNLSNDSKSSEECVLTNIHTSSGDSMASSFPTAVEKIKDKKTKDDKYSTFMNSSFGYSGDWGDSPLPNSTSDSLQCSISDIKEKQKANKVPKSHKNEIEKNKKANSSKIKQNSQQQTSNDELVIKDNDKLSNLPSRRSPSLANGDENLQKAVSSSVKPVVKQYSDITGVVKTVNEYNGIVECTESHDKVPFSFTTFYVDEKYAPDISVNLIGILKESDTVKLNYFEINNDIDKWKLASLVWLGKKPKSAKEFTAEELINSHKLQNKTNLEVESLICNIEEKTQNIKTVTSNKGPPLLDKNQPTPLKSYLKQPEMCKEEEKLNATASKTNDEAMLHDIKNNAETPLNTLPTKMVSYIPTNQMIFPQSGSAIYRPPMFPQPQQRYFGNTSDQLYYHLQDSAVYRHQYVPQLCTTGIVPWPSKTRMPQVNISPSPVNSSAFPIGVHLAYSDSCVVGSKNDACVDEHFKVSNLKDVENLKDTKLKHPQNIPLIKNTVIEAANLGKLVDSCKIKDMSKEECSTLKTFPEPCKQEAADNSLRGVAHSFEGHLLLQNSTHVKNLTLESAEGVKNIETIPDHTNLSDKNSTVRESLNMSKSVTPVANSTDKPFANAIKKKSSGDSLDELGCKTFYKKLSNVEVSDKLSVQKTSKHSVLDDNVDKQHSIEVISTKPFHDNLTTVVNTESKYSSETDRTHLIDKRENTKEGELATEGRFVPLDEHNPSLEPENIIFSRLDDFSNTGHSGMSDETDERMMKHVDLILNRLFQKYFHIHVPHSSNEPICHHLYQAINRSKEMVDKACQTEDRTLVNQHVLVRPELKTSQSSVTSVRSKETQTFMTGKVFCIDILPS